MARILLVDDDPATLDVLDFSLTLQGHETLRAVDGAEAVEVARREVPDVVVLDWMMPVMNGILAARTLRDDPTTTDIPILMLTALGRDADLLRGYQSGVASYLTKPVDVEILQAEIVRLAGAPTVSEVT